MATINVTNQTLGHLLLLKKRMKKRSYEEVIKILIRGWEIDNRRTRTIDWQTEQDRKIREYFKDPKHQNEYEIAKAKNPDLTEIAYYLQVRKGGHSTVS